MITDKKSVVLQHANDPFTLAVAVLAERIGSLPNDDREDLFELFKAYCAATEARDDEAVESAYVAMNEIIEKTPSKLMRVLTVDNASQSVGKWISFISNKIKELRKASGMTQEQLSNASGLPQSHISRLENGEHSPSFSTIEKLAKAFGVPVSELDPSA